MEKICYSHWSGVTDESNDEECNKFDSDDDDTLEDAKNGTMTMSHFYYNFWITFSLSQ